MGGTVHDDHVRTTRHAGLRRWVRRRLVPFLALNTALLGAAAAMVGMASDRPPPRWHHAPDALTIHVRAHRWRWEFEQPNGMIEGELLIPANRVVRLRIRSEPNGPGELAVVHQLSIPALGVRAPALPGRWTEVTFIAEREGDYPILCTEFCGTGHSRMQSWVRVVSRADYDNPQYCTLGDSPDGVSEAQWGRQLFTSNGCSACHSVDGPGGPGGPRTHGSIGPDLRAVAGRYRHVEGPAYVLADEAYLRRAIVSPDAEQSLGYRGVQMPAFNLPQSQLRALIAYLWSMSSPPFNPYLPPHLQQETLRD